MNLDRRLLRLARSVRAGLALTVGLGLAGGALLVVQARVLSRAISDVFLGGRTLDDVTPLLLALAGIGLLRAGMVWGGRVAAQGVAGRVKGDLRGRLFAHLLALGPAYTQSERSGELTHTLLEGVEALDAYFADYLPGLALAALVPLTFLAVVLPLDPLSGLVLLLTAPLIPLFMVLIGRAAERLTRRQWTALSRMSAHFLDALQGLTTLKLFGRSRRQIAVIARLNDQWRATTLGVLRVAFLSALALELLATISTAIVAVTIGLRLLYGGLDFERALMVLILAPEYYLPLRALGVKFHAGIAGAAAATRIFAILETPAPVAPAAPETEGLSSLSGPLSRRLEDLDMHLAFQDVRYAYPDGRAALDGVTFAIEPGQRVALVGPSGAGKSTLAALLLRFIAPQGGQITVDGLPLAVIDPDAWRARVAWVPGRPYLFHATALDNIRLGRPDATPDEVIGAARQAHAHDFIAALPDGYQTVIGERGARLSGGQAQRIALARAFLRDAPLLILDEATAHLDAASEALIEAAMAKLMRGRTALIIAHRLRTVREADVIVVLDEGRVAESGSHAALMDSGGLYSRLVAAYDA